MLSKSKLVKSNERFKQITEYLLMEWLSIVFSEPQTIRINKSILASKALTNTARIYPTCEFKKRPLS